MLQPGHDQLDVAEELTPSADVSLMLTNLSQQRTGYRDILGNGKIGSMYRLAASRGAAVV